VLTPGTARKDASFIADRGARGAASEPKAQALFGGALSPSPSPPLRFNAAPARRRPSGTLAVARHWLDGSPRVFCFLVPRPAPCQLPGTSQGRGFETMPWLGPVPPPDTASPPRYSVLTAQHLSIPSLGDGDRRRAQTGRVADPVPRILPPYNHLGDARVCFPLGLSVCSVSLHSVFGVVRFHASSTAGSFFPLFLIFFLSSIHSLHETAGQV
jgi:hypothetical protein